MRPFFCYYGGKHRIAPLYPAPTRRSVVEPFAGSAGYATLYYQRDVLLIERDERIAALWAFLIRATPSDILSIPLLEAGDTTDAIGGPEEARSLVGFWLNKGVSSPRKSPSAWMRAGTHAGSFWGAAVRARLAAQVSLIKHWKVISASYEAASDLEATWFIDPPYQVAGKHYRMTLSGDDFARLGEWTRARRGQVIACENVGATWLPFVKFVDAKANESRTGGKRSAEAIWLSHEATPMPLFEGAT